MDDFDLDFGEEEATLVSLNDITVSQNAQITIGMAVKEISQHFKIEEKLLIKHLRGNVYFLPESNRLMIIFPFDDGDMFVEIPEGEWMWREQPSN